MHNNLIKDFSFYSAHHKTYSRIDYILVSSSLFSNNPFIKMLPILLSDHSPKICSFVSPGLIPKWSRWRFNTTLLTNSDFIGKLKLHLLDFLGHNKYFNNPQLLWEACKCSTRGFCISFSSFQKKVKNKRFTGTLNRNIGETTKVPIHTR